MKNVGIICAIDREFALIKEHFGSKFTKTIHHGREFLSGNMDGIQLTLVQSKIGKVSAALTTALLVQLFNIEQIVFVGCAGALKAELKCGDIVVADSAAQHDFDGRPFAPECTILTLGEIYIKSDPVLKNLLLKASQKYAQDAYLKLP